MGHAPPPPASSISTRRPAWYNDEVEKITYLIANYNCAPYLAECLGSVVAQDDPNWLCLICDDGSTDDSIAVIEKAIRESGVPERFELLRNPRNMGCIETQKRLIAAASTDIVGTLDADDLLCPQATRRVLAEYRKDPQIAFVYSRYITIDRDSKQIPINSPVCSPIPPGKTALIYGYVLALRTFRKSAYERTSGFNSSIVYAEDRDLVYLLEEVAQPHFIDEVLYKYRLVRGSQSTDENKFRIGVRNDVLARRNALERRGVRGFDRLVHEAINHCLLARSAGYGPLRTKAYRYLMKALVKAVQWTGHSSGRIARAR